MDNIQISTTQEVDISLQADDIDYIVLNDGVSELQHAIKDIVSEDKLTQSIITAVGDAKYQEALVSGTNIKTINGTSILGSGDITISGGGDMTNYYTKTEIDNLIGDINNELASI